LPASGNATKAIPSGGRRNRPAAGTLSGSAPRGCASDGGHRSGAGQCTLRFARPVEEFTKAVLSDPKFTLAFNARAYAHIRLRRYREALKLNPYYAKADRNRAVSRLALGNKTGADADQTNAEELLAPPN
jgi:hypothetical protein